MAEQTAFETYPKKLRIDLKAWATRCLKGFDERENWWADRGSIRWIYNDEGLEAANIHWMVKIAEALISHCGLEE